MKLSQPYREYIIQFVSYLYVILFVYAGVSKLLDFENFTVQLGQSPLLSAFAGWVSWAVPLTEFILSLLLLQSPTRTLALFASYLLMVMFSVYIFIILNYSEFVPCSCGGILEKMTWQQHLAFNLAFCFLALIALKLSRDGSTTNRCLRNNRVVASAFVLGNLLAVGTVVLLYIQSEKIVHEQNNFVRRFPPHIYEKTAKLDLKYKDYYFAGAAGGVLYLGNYSSPLSITAINQKLQVLGNYTIRLDNYTFPFRSAQIRIASPYFYLADGTVPCIFKGKISDWKAAALNRRDTYFSAFAAIDTTTIAFRGKSSTSGENILGTISTDTSTKTNTNPRLLQKQIDGIFDTDGMLHYNNQQQCLVYLYYYRNQFIIAKRNLTLIRRGATIDTTTHAKIKITKLANGTRKLSAPPSVVNKYSATAGRFLYINSGLRGRFESISQWKESAIIDVYDLQKGTYAYSLPVYAVNDKKLHAMYATEKQLFFLIDNAIVSYTLKEENLPRR